MPPIKSDAGVSCYDEEGEYFSSSEEEEVGSELS